VEYETGVPHFQIFKYPIANNFDVASPMGVSVFANSIDPLGGTDTAYHSWWEDNENSRKKVFVDDESTGVNKKKTIDNQGNVSVRSVKYVDKDQTMFQTLDLGEEKMKIYTPDFSTLPHEEAIQMNLNLVAFKCSLGTDYYNFKDGSVYVNEKSVLSSTSDLWRNRQKAINRLKEVLGRMAYSILFLEKKIGNYNGELTFTIKVSIDDSIVEDDESKLAKVKSMAESGWIPPYIYTAKALKISVKEAAMLYAEALGLDEEESKRYIESLENG
jgi:A118 family predicted phage portal protein